MIGQEAQFRKLATEVEHQGKGYGSALLKHIFLYAYEKQIKRLWCNARRDKTSFYTKFGMQTIDKTFIKGGVEYIIMEYISS